MKRKCEQYNITPFLDILGITQATNIELYIDDENKNEIIPFLKTRKSKFRRILYAIYSNEYSGTLYKKESDNIMAMRFTGKGSNVRIGCKEYNINGKKVIMIAKIYKK